MIDDSQIESTVNGAIARITALENDGLVDDTSNLRDRAVYILSGSNDTWFRPANQEATKRIFENYMMEGDFLKFESDTARNNLRNHDASKLLEYIYESLGYTS